MKMKMCEEGLFYLEALEKRQIRIYNDAWDVGIPLAHLNLYELRDHLRRMMQSLGYKKKVSTNTHTVEMFLPLERDGNFISGFRITVSKHIDRKIAGGGFASIDMFRCQIVA